MTDKKQVNNLTIQINVEITDEDIDDIMCTALEGGIDYWCTNAEVLGEYLGEYSHEQISRGGRLKIWLIEPFDKTDTSAYILDKRKFLRGLRMYLEDPEKPYNILEAQYVKDKYGNIKRGQAKTVIDCCEVDATVADMIIQYALFGEIVFA